MKSTVFWALVALNALLLISFIGRITHENAAMAQNAGAGAKDPNAGRPRMPGDMVMISGEVTGGVSGVVYIVDTTNGYLSAMTYDDARGELSAMPKIDLARVFEGGNRGAGAGGNNRMPNQPRRP
jgi:hypothetical protein